MNIVYKEYLPLIS